VLLDIALLSLCALTSVLYLWRSELILVNALAVVMAILLRLGIWVPLCISLMTIGCVVAKALMSSRLAREMMRDTIAYLTPSLAAPLLSLLIAWRIVRGLHPLAIPTMAAIACLSFLIIRSRWLSEGFESVLKVMGYTVLGLCLVIGLAEGLYILAAVLATFLLCMCIAGRKLSHNKLALVEGLALSIMLLVSVLA